MEIANKDNARVFLAQNLVKESLSLFLGAGISRSFELDGWKALLNNMCKDEEICVEPLDNTKKYTADEYQVKADEISRKLNHSDEKLIKLVSKYLYKGLDLETSFNVYQHKQLISLSSLIMGSKRGRVKTVFTLNYDSLLEYYLQSFGFTVNTISMLPYFASGYDVEIFHPHGYIPHSVMKQKNSDEIILSKLQADNRVGVENSPWRLLMKHYLSKNVFLFIGMSDATAGDRMISPILTNVKREVDRVLGVWIFKHEVKHSVVNSLKDLGIASIVMKEEDEIADFLISISREAMRISLDKMKN